jgi:dTDP-4-dehydrorhamnose 3,5-epimerase-like enzyme
MNAALLMPEAEDTAPPATTAGAGLVRWVELKVMGDHQGSLVALEATRQVPFLIARVYYVFGTRPGASRGFHAHRTLSQLCVAVAGSCRMVLDDGRTRAEARLDRPDRGLLIGPGLWREMHGFSPDCVLLVLADAPFDEADYIREYGAFLRSVRP